MSITTEQQVRLDCVIAASGDAKKAKACYDFIMTGEASAPTTRKRKTKAETEAEAAAKVEAENEAAAKAKAIAEAEAAAMADATGETSDADTANVAETPTVETPDENPFSEDTPTEVAQTFTHDQVRERCAEVMREGVKRPLIVDAINKVSSSENPKIDNLTTAEMTALMTELQTLEDAHKADDAGGL